MERTLTVQTVMVAAPDHPLAALKVPISTSVLAEHVQLVLTDRTNLSAGTEFGVMSPKTWKLADLGAKLSFLKAGLGWGSMPLSSVKDEIVTGQLVALDIEGLPERGYTVPMSIIFLAAKPPGPAARWLVQRLKTVQ